MHATALEQIAIFFIYLHFCLMLINTAEKIAQYEVFFSVGMSQSQIIQMARMKYENSIALFGATFDRK